jgi:GNAT superfamily N-acetyltransferase
MKIIEYFACDRQDHWLRQLETCTWEAGRLLSRLLEKRELRHLCGDTTRLLLLTDGDTLVSFCTLAEQDDIRAPSLTPWVGFVYTFPAYRGRRCFGQLLDAARRLAAKEGHHTLYISTCEVGLYEKYGCRFDRFLKDLHGEDSRVYRLDF